ncbi:alpha-amylase family glycosyl hydrolase [Deinococcus cellulosilyticus]|uniref:Fibronectin type-III domain-containing protein n=1 Tax=Deinococcus cellulosilyticus (strain DSM 18568 / NBRC 106333 / KACC 11606 / 5516J-15) TaxID=1223518 RepID=A0A511MWV7_DEIC1|nr:alpha-amylase family glycosyl hydrolase [Deinococcus cellulosilyticus]GEM45063.1 hypothetical protein DC3_06980 [Deinococcus cellulosilyticus NBRC 106333 = KACC 11606]
MKQPSNGNRQRFRLQHALAGLTLALALSSCNLFTNVPPVTNPGPVINGQDVLYFALTDRFANGDTSNDNGTKTRTGDTADKTNPIGWHGGDFKGITQKINEGYFEKLGVTAIWISPVYLQVPGQLAGDGPNKGKYHTGYHGYWAEDFLKVDPHFGTLQDLKDLVRAAHARGLKIVQDMVINHAGYGAQLTKDHPDWFNTAADCNASTNKDVDCDLAGLPDFKQEKAEVTKFLNDTVAYWIKEVGINGIRMDTMKHVPDAYWKQFFANGGVADPAKIWTVGEVLVGDVNFNKKFINDLGSPALFDFPLQFALKENLSTASGNLNAVARIFDQDSLYNDPNKLVTLVDNHDVKRFMSEAVDRGVPVAEAKERLDLALSLIFTSRGTPSVYYGTEIGMIGKGDAYNNVLGETSREDMDFSKLAENTLDERIKALSDARKKSASLRSGKQEILSRPETNGGKSLLAYRRTLEGADPVVVLINNSNTDLDLSTLAAGKVQLLGTFAKGSILSELTGKPLTVNLDADGNLTGNVAKHSALILSAKVGTAPGTDPTLGAASNLTSQSGTNGVKINWTPSEDANIAGYRVYVSENGTQFTPYNLEPVSTTQNHMLVLGLDNNKTYTFKVVGVGKNGKEAVNAPTLTAKPNPSVLSSVTFTVDARALGDADVEVRHFDNGQQEYQMTEKAGQPGIWTVTQQLPLFKPVVFKFGDDSSTAKNSGYEGAGQGDRVFIPDDLTDTYQGVYNFITLSAPSSFISGKVTSAGKPLKKALLNSSLEPQNYYAVSRKDGSYYLPLPDSQTVDITASKNGYASKTIRASSGSENANVDLALAIVGSKYTLDGDLSDWTAPKLTLTNAPGGYDTGFGNDNILKEIRVDADSKYLYLGYVYRASGNSAILHFDHKTGGFTNADALNAWPRKATFNLGIDFFVAQYQNNEPELRLTNGNTVDLNENFFYETTGSAPEYTTEVIIPWTSLGLADKPAILNGYAGIYGGDHYGAGDILPSEKSTPAYTGNKVAGYDQQREVTFTKPFTLAP